MYVTRILSGRPYQAYVPTSLYPKVTPEQFQIFASIDSWLTSTIDADGFARRFKYSLIQTGKRIEDSGHLSNAQAAFEVAIAEKTLDCKKLKRAHARMTGASKSDFRTGPGWVGGPHPSMAWHVGSPAEDLSRLMARLMSPPSGDHPASITACIQLFRILQIHPFSDGNGRIARLVSMRFIFQKIGPAVGFLDLIDSLWDRARIDINSISLQTQIDDDFNPIFNKIGEISRSLQKALPIIRPLKTEKDGA